MRKSWIVVLVLGLTVGLAAGYRFRRQAPKSSPPESAKAQAATPPDDAPPRGETAIPPGPADRGPEPPSEPDVLRPAERGSVGARPSESRGTAGWNGSPHPVAAPSAPAGSPVSPAPSAIATQDAPPPTIPNDAPEGAPSAIPATKPSPPAPDTDEQKSAEGDDSESDRRPPTLQMLRFDPLELKGGGTATLAVGAVDDLSGVKLIYGSVRSPSGSAAVPFSARDAGGGAFVAAIAIPPQAETGDWYVGNLQIVDKADNALALAYVRATVPSGGTIRVVSEDSDATAPTVHRVTVVRGVVDAGETNQVVVDIDDDRSGVALVTGAFQSPSKAAFIPFTCTPNGESTWEGQVQVPPNADCGEWTLRQLRVVDKANNSAFLAMDAPEIGRVGFVVSSGGECDSEPPLLDEMSFAPSVVSNAEASTLIVTVRAHDDASGVASVSGWIDGPVATNGQAPRIYFASTPDPKDPDAPMTARVTVAQYAATGVWRVSVAQVADKARNTRTYNANDPVLREAHFTVD